MIHQALIRSVILDKRRAPGRQADPAGEERLVDGKRRVNRGSPAVDERGAWKRQVDQASPLKICGHLVGDPPSVAGLLGQMAQAVRCGLGEKLPVEFIAAASMSPPRRFQKCSSPAPCTSGWHEMICSHSVVPERGIPKISTGVGSGFPCERALWMKSIEKRLMIASTRRSKAAAWRAAAAARMSEAASKAGIASP